MINVNINDRVYVDSCENIIYTVSCIDRETNTVVLRTNNGLSFSGISLSRLTLTAGCQHEWELYTGLISQFEYCTKCDAKKEGELKWPAAR